MNVQMGNGFSPIGAVVDHNAIAVLTKAFLPSRCSCCREQCSEKYGIGGRCLINPRDATLRDHEKVDGCLRSDISESDPLLTLGNDGGWDLPSSDLLKKSHGRVGACSWELEDWQRMEAGEMDFSLQAYSLQSNSLLLSAQLDLERLPLT
jgi:hypothetical protein